MEAICRYCTKTGSPYQCGECQSYVALCDDHMGDHICPECDKSNVSWFTNGFVIDPPSSVDEDFKYTSPVLYDDDFEDDNPYSYGNPQSWESDKEEEDEKEVLTSTADCGNPSCTGKYVEGDVALYECGNCEITVLLCDNCNSSCPDCNGKLTFVIQDETNSAIKEIKEEFEDFESDPNLNSELDEVGHCEEDEDEILEETGISSENHRCTESQVEEYNKEQKKKRIKLIPPYEINSTYCGEYIRQLKLQIKAIEKMTVWEWMVNTALNRLKDPQLAGSQVTSDFIFNSLRKNKELAVAVLQKLRERSNELKTNSKDDFHTELIAIIDKSLQANDPMLEFYSRKGLVKLIAQQYVGGEGGAGRQHGSGDEKTFRELHEEAIKLIKEELAGENNNKPKLAVLHNPDQCVGGPMEILWDDDEREKTYLAKKAYVDCKNEIHTLNMKIMEPDSWSTVPVDKDALKRKVEELKVQLEELKKEYLEQIYIHVGLNFVNTQIGFCWMPEKGPSKVVFIFREALKLENPETTLMSIGIPINVKEAKPKTTYVKKKKEVKSSKTETKKRKRMSDSDRVLKNIGGKEAVLNKKRKIIETKLEQKRTPLITSFFSKQNTSSTNLTMTTPSINTMNAPTMLTHGFKKGDKVQKKTSSIAYKIVEIDDNNGTAVIEDSFFRQRSTVNLSDLKKV